MTLSKKIKKLALVTSLLAPASMVVAEDIDLYQGGSAITGNKPNVLIILDNSANWNANNQGWGRDANGDLIKQGKFELQAIDNVLEGLRQAGNDVRVGLMMFASDNSNPDGGYVRYAIRDMTDGREPETKNIAAFQSVLRGIVTNFGNQEQVASAKTKYSNAFYEAFKYFSGKSRYSANDDKRDYTGNGNPTTSPYTAGSILGNAFSSVGSNTYSTPLSTDAPCSKNFIIFIGNGFPSQDVSDPATLGDPDLAGFNSTQIYSSSKINYSDEWTRFLKNVGAKKFCTGSGASEICTDSTITTYTVDVYKDQQDIEETNLLKSMAKVGGGEYYRAQSADDVKAALQSIFYQIQAVNSVFASSSLPVSVNTQGTYLNQIYMGVFRPDVKGRPRWLGNLKQYQFKITTDATGAETLVLADADDVPAVSSTTGFIKTDARSYWTHGSTFWTNIYNATTADYSDRPDGALVEKGAAAQQLREKGTDFSLPATRKMLTCIPNCTTGTTPSSFDTTNAALVTALNPATTNVTLTRAGPLVTATTVADLGLSGTPESITISGANVAAYNGSWTATRVDANHFTFTIPETPVTPATGTLMTVSSSTGVDQSVADTKMTYNNGTVYVNLPLHGFVTGQSVTVSGANVSASMSTATTKCTSQAATPPNNNACEYNGTFTVTVVDANNFTYTPPATNYGIVQTTATSIDPPEAIGAGNTEFACGSGSKTTLALVANTSVTRPAGGGAGSTRRITITPSSVPAVCSSPLTTTGSKGVVSVTLKDTGSPTLDGKKITSFSIGKTACGGTNDNVICFDVALTSQTVVTGTTTIIPASPATGTIVANGKPTRRVTSITRGPGNGSNIATVTLRTSGSHGFSGASSVEVLGADQAEYNGVKNATQSLAFPADDTITYTLVTGPAAAASGTAAKGANQVDANVLINWMRGVDNKDDENSDGSLADVRASIHGDVLHSRPAIVNYGAQYGGTAASPRIVGFYGSNDGTLRAVQGGQNSTDGGEKWAFLAPEHKNTWNRIYANSPIIKFPSTSPSFVPTPTPRNYYWDGNIGVYQSSDLATTHIFAAMRRGGRAIYALDVSNPDDPKYLWSRSNASTTSSGTPTMNGDAKFAELGFTWSTPQVIPIKKTAGVSCNLADATTYTRALVFGAGYDPAEEDKAAGTVRNPTMGRGVFVLNAATGELIKLLQPADVKKYSFAADVTLMDSDRDGCVDRMYAVDTGANVFRFDIGDTDPANWKTYKIAMLGDVGNDGGSDDRKFLYAADPVAYSNAGTQLTFLMVGSGNRELPRDEAIQDMFFMIKDPVPANGTTDPVVPARVDAGGTNLLTKVTNFNASTTGLTTEVVTASSFHGWYIQYDQGEKTVNAPLTVSGVTYFGTNLPKAPTAICTPNLGTARGYAINFLSGTSAAGDRNADGTIGQSDLYSNLIGGGLPPSAVAGTVCIDGNCKRFCIGCGTEGKESSAIEAAKVHATPDPRRKRVFWYYKKDE